MITNYVFNKAKAQFMIKTINEANGYENEKLPISILLEQSWDETEADTKVTLEGCKELQNEVADFFQYVRENMWLQPRPATGEVFSVPGGNFQFYALYDVADAIDDNTNVYILWMTTFGRIELQDLFEREI